MESQSQQFLDFAMKAIQQQKKKIIDKVADETVKLVRSESMGQMDPVVTKTESGFVASVQPGALDPTGAKLLETEKATRAVETTAKMLSNKDYVVSLINKAE